MFTEMADNNRMRRRVLHTSDLHLESFGEKACDNLRAVVNLAISARVDLVIIAGDLFEHNRVADDLVGFVVGQLRRIPAYVAILPGNHDCLTPGSIFDRDDLWQDCAKVRIFRAVNGEILNLPDLGLTLWGKAIDSYDHDVLPLAGIPQPRGNGQWNIAVAHGYYVKAKPSHLPSYNITHEEIVASGWDYIALGHVTLFRCVCAEPVKAYYSGSPSLAGTVNIVDLDEERGVLVNRYPLSSNEANQPYLQYI